MSTIHLAAPGHADVDALLAFELANRAFFESTINARPRGYYSRRPAARAMRARPCAGNLGSVRVLLRNGFVQFGHSRNSFELGGLWYDRLHFERHALTSTS
jgi:RimJ/RimL family protein N-acetyltransferase